MDKNNVMRSLQKELQIQEKLNKEISEKTLQLNKSKKQSAMYRKWLKKLDQLEMNQIKRMNEIDKKMHDALMQMDEKAKPCEAQTPASSADSVEFQSLFDIQEKSYPQK